MSLPACTYWRPCDAMWLLSHDAPCVTHLLLMYRVALCSVQDSAANQTACCVLNSLCGSSRFTLLAPSAGKGQSEQHAGMPKPDSLHCTRQSQRRPRHSDSNATPTQANQLTTVCGHSRHDSTVHTKGQACMQSMEQVNCKVHGLHLILPSWTKGTTRLW